MNMQGKQIPFPVPERVNPSFGLRGMASTQIEAFQPKRDTQRAGA